MDLVAVTQLNALSTAQCAPRPVCAPLSEDAVLFQSELLKKHSFD